MANPEYASIHSLELRKQPHEVYEAFYNLYGAEGFVDTDGSTSSGHIIEGRVLHDDMYGQRDVHLIVRQRDGILLPPSHRRRYENRIQHLFSYSEETFIVATTDGASIERWQVVNAYGIHEGRIDAILQPYRPENETVHVQLVNSLGNGAELSFNMASGCGTMSLPEGRVGWILGEVESGLERARVMNLTAVLGHTATAS